MTDYRSEYLPEVEKALTGPIVEVGTDRLTIRDMTLGEDVPVRIDDRTIFKWLDKEQEGRLTDTARVRVGYFFGGGVHTAREVIVLEPGNGASITERIVHTVH